MVGARGRWRSSWGAALAAAPLLDAAPALNAQALAAPASPVPSQAELTALWGGGTWLPDRFNMGSWMSGFKSLQEYTNPDFVPPNPVPLNAEAMKVYRNIRSELGKGHQIFGPYAQCHPAGMPYRLSLGSYKVVVAKDELVFLFGDDHDYREVFIDGRPHPDPNTTPATYNGHSVGHWEGRTLVIDTANIRADNTQVEPHIPKPEGSHVVERYTPTAQGVMDVQFTMTDPEFTKPWTVSFRVLKTKGGQLNEYMCTDGNRYTLAPGGELTLHSASGAPLEKAED